MCPLPGLKCVYRNMLCVLPFRVHSRKMFTEPASVTHCWSDDLQEGWENQPNGQMWTSRPAFDAAASNSHLCLTPWHQTDLRTTSVAFPLSYTPSLKESRLHLQLEPLFACFMNTFINTDDVKTSIFDTYRAQRKETLKLFLVKSICF